MAPRPSTHPGRRPWWVAPALAAIVLVFVNLLLWTWAESRRKTNEEHIFRGRAELLIRDIKERVENDADALRALRGFVQAEGTPSPAGWHAFLVSMDAKTRYPGIRSAQFDLRVDAAAASVFNERAGKDGRPALWDSLGGRGAPPRKADSYFPILLTEPREPEILSYDSSSREDVRAGAQVPAAESGQLALGPAFHPQQDASTLVVSMVAPIYAATADPPTLEARKEGLRGFVTLLLNPEHLFAGLGDEMLLDYKIFDGTASGPVIQARGHGGGPLVHQETLQVLGRTWTVAVSSTPWWSNLGRRESWQLLGSGLAVSLGLLAAIAALALARERALSLADRMTSELREANRALLALATTDPLTGLLNRRAMDTRSAEEEARATRDRTPLSVVAADVDFFKHVNDKYGHAMGDEVLRNLGQLLREATRVTDHAARMGGEEFLLLCPNTDAAGAVVLAEQLRSRFEAMEHQEGDQRIRCTVSFGVAASEQGAPVEAGRLMKRADLALYRAKGAGRNRVEIWTPPVVSEEA
ncbi:MAG: sensor domain-containing diguanylate cyclase [Acidobacteria bacterium]|nr:sensor domain-containing diguanylate cyclase [Acidobacteriota bacterium]